MFRKFLCNKSITMVKGVCDTLTIDYIDNGTCKFTVTVPQEALIILVEKLIEFTKTNTLPTEDITGKYFCMLPNYNSLFEFDNKVMAFMFTGIDIVTSKPKGSLCYLYMDDFLQFAKELIDFKKSLEEVR